MRGRLLSVRAFDAEGMALDADVVEGDEMEQLIDRLLVNPDVDRLHVHTARQGCYLGRVDRTA